jgi:hypothetical protein
MARQPDDATSTTSATITAAEATEASAAAVIEPSEAEAVAATRTTLGVPHDVHAVKSRPGARTRLTRRLQQLLELAASDADLLAKTGSDHASAYQASVASIAVFHYTVPRDTLKALWREAGIKVSKRVLRLNPVLPTVQLVYADRDIPASKRTQDAQAIRGAVEGAFEWKEGQKVPSRDRLLQFFSESAPRLDGKRGTVVGRDRGLQFYRRLPVVQAERGNKLTEKLQADAERERELLDQTDTIAHIELADEELAAIRARTGGEVPSRALAIISFEEGRLCLQRVGTSDRHAISMAWEVAEKVASSATSALNDGPEELPVR